MGGLPVTAHDLFSERECCDLADRVMALRARWTHRGAGFFTLGAASYLDAAAGRERYDDLASTANPLLEESFSDVHLRLVDFLERLLRQPVRIDPSLAVPGFHIFELNGTYRDPKYILERAHFDLQWRFLTPGDAWPATLSFTIPIELPSGGGAMQIWDGRYEEVLLAGSHAKAYARDHRSKRLTYHVGRSVVHDGMILHAIGESLECCARGYRITLQGHVMQGGNAWLLYW